MKDTRYYLAFTLSALAAACLFNYSAASNKDNEEEQALKQLLNTLNDSYKLTIDVTAPHLNTPMFTLGMELFFSKALSGNQDVACASCHHPFLAGGDSLSLPIGEAPYDEDIIGPGRWHDWQRSADPKADGAPNVARHSQTIINASLYKEAMFYDGRIFVLENDTNKADTPLPHRTPDSNLWQGDQLAGKNLLATQARFPVVSSDEMRGYTFAAASTNEDTRHKLTKRLQQHDKNQQWLKLFRNAFNDLHAAPEQLFTFENIATAISYYQSTQLLINTPWFNYLNGESDAMTPSQKRGAQLFLKSAKQGGAGCIECHTPPIFSDEKFHNIAAVQVGRGKQPSGEDYGRRGVTQKDDDRYKFRTPSLLNVAATAPYTHSGAFINLESVIKHHLDPAKSLQNFDYSFADNPQLSYVASLLSNSKLNSHRALEQLQNEQQKGVSLLASGITLSDAQLSDLIAFLNSLTDPCINSRECMSKWVPTETDKAPDIHRLNARFKPFTAPPQPISRISHTESNLPQMSFDNANIKPALLLSDMEFGCKSRTSIPPQNTSAAKRFDEVSLDAGISHQHHITWQNYTLLSAQRLLFSGGVAMGDIDGDCWPDIFFPTGDGAPDKLYQNQRNGHFSDITRSWGITQKELSNGAAMVDIDGDGDLDIFTSNLLHPHLPSVNSQVNKHPHHQSPTLYLNEQQHGFIVSHDIGLNTQLTSWSFAFADYDKDGDVDMLTNHWRGPGLGGQLPNHLWENTSQENTLTFQAQDETAGLLDLIGSTDFTFTSNFSDFNNDGWLDLLFTADFETSQVYKNLQNGRFEKVTHEHSIHDQNGMGAAIADFDNNGTLDWFVSSIWDPNGQPEGSWGVIGNRLYSNQNNQFIDITEQAGVDKGLWAWGACFADFNNDGWLDLFHVNGFDLPKQLSKRFANPRAYQKLKLAMAEFEKTHSRLFISNQDGTFTEQSKLWGIGDQLSGRGVACVDYDRDGDIDIVINNHQQAPLLYKNRHNDESKDSYLSISLRDTTKNTRALGAKVYVTVGETTQLQEVQAGGSFLSGAPSTLHFGLGQASQADTIKIVWPDKTNTVSTFTNVPANQFIYITTDLTANLKKYRK
ncbi:hypothetical protein EXT42_06775 [Pseudoalteromonas sp. CO302Y]|uniref:FG-GAP-like repeat-containing protein n=1 Tax=unclassified Pseudoalteromonas TaxID=194690 RepID=UPI001023C425|nr:hypothetical protein EXT42_06775 [Pseudoalteromonas sp. CO302Y]RZG10483.1 hypothetical protein EXT40_06785 [Pseudoalteromonas sp. CO133X]